MALPKYTEPHYRIWHYMYIFICTCVFFFLIAPLFVIFPLSFNAEEFLSFSEGMKNLDPDAFSLRWYKDMIYGTKNPWGLAAKNSFIIAIFATLGSVILGTVAALGLSSRHMPYKGLIMATLIRTCSNPYRNNFSTYYFRYSICSNYCYSNIVWL